MLAFLLPSWRELFTKDFMNIVGREIKMYFPPKNEVALVRTATLANFILIDYIQHVFRNVPKILSGVWNICYILRSVIIMNIINITHNIIITDVILIHIVPGTRTVNILITVTMIIRRTDCCIINIMIIFITYHLHRNSNFNH